MNITEPKFNYFQFINWIIYDPETKLSTAMKTLLNHWKIIYEISKMNRKRGLSPQKFNDVWAYFMERKKIN